MCLTIQKLHFWQKFYQDVVIFTVFCAHICQINLSHFELEWLIVNLIETEDKCTDTVSIYKCIFWCMGFPTWFLLINSLWIDDWLPVAASYQKHYCLWLWTSFITPRIALGLFLDQCLRIYMQHELGLCVRPSRQLQSVFMVVKILPLNY